MQAFKQVPVSQQGMKLTGLTCVREATGKVQAALSHEVGSGFTCCERVTVFSRIQFRSASCVQKSKQ